MSTRLFTVERDGPGTLATMAAPPGGAGLEAGMTELAAVGVGLLVCMLGPAERAMLELDGEPQAADAAGIAFLDAGTDDFAVPDPAALLALADRAVAHLAAGGHVVTHCRMGIGRASLAAAAVLVREGVAVDDAWARIARARGRAVPDTPAQRVFLEQWARSHAGNEGIAPGDS